MEDIENETDPTWDPVLTSDEDSDEGVEDTQLNYVPAWHAVFGTDAENRRHCRPVDVHFNEIIEEMASVTMEGDETIEAANRRLVFPYLSTLDVHQSVSFRIDVDSMKALVHFEVAAEVFHQQPRSLFGVQTEPDETAAMISLLTALPRSADHLKGVGFVRNREAGRSAGLSSIPKVPSPSRLNVGEECTTRTWFFPQCGTTQRQSWVSLAEVPHFLLGQAVGREWEELNVWCICFGAAIEGAGPSECKKAAQRVLHFVKKEGTSCLTLLGNDQANSANSQDCLHQAHPMSMTTMNIVEKCLEKWKPSNAGCETFRESIRGYFLRWTLFAEAPDFMSASDRFVTPPGAFDIICKLFVHSIEDPRVPLTTQERSMLRHSMIYYDGKGLKDRLNRTTARNAPSVDPTPLEELVDRFTPSLRLVSRGLCRIDVGYEWTPPRSNNEDAMLWSVRNFKRLIAAMPARWRQRVRLYGCLGLGEAVDIQAHDLYWIPPPPMEMYELGEIPRTSTDACPSPSGLQYFNLRVPNHRVASFVEDAIAPEAHLFEEISVVNVYCPGPRKLTSAFGKAWGLQFDPVGPLMALMAELGEGSGLREEMGIGVGKIRKMADGFLAHIQRELPAQKCWGLRAEVGGKSIRSACRLLDFFASSNGLSPPNQLHHEQNVCDDREHQAIICIPLRDVTKFMSLCIDQWVKLLHKAASVTPMERKMALFGICAEQALRAMTFLVRGQNPWTRAVSRLLIHGGVLGFGALLPQTIQSHLGELEGPRLRECLQEVNNAFVVGQTRLANKGHALTLGRIFDTSVQVRKLVENLVSNSSTSIDRRCVDLVRLLLQIFYGDLRDYLVRRRHWASSSRAPEFLSPGSDCVFDVETLQTRLKEPSYNAHVENPSFVHPSTGFGRRTISNTDFLTKWFPHGGRGHPKLNRNWNGARSKWFLCTRIIWDVVTTNIPEDKMKALQATFLKVVADARSLHEEGAHPMRTIRPSGILVPDGIGPRRPFNTVNRWLEVVGPTESPFQAPPRVQPAEQEARAQTVTRKVLKEEFGMFRASNKRGFTDHELNVLSMYMLLEGAEDRLNDIGQAHNIRCNMQHVDAFIDHDKCLLYCFRIRRNVEQINDKVNAAFRARGRRVTDWSLREVVRRIEACLGNHAIGLDGRLSKERAHQWLVSHKAETLYAYRGGFDLGLGPKLDYTNESLWNDHMAKHWSHPIPRELWPINWRESENHFPEPRPCSIPQNRSMPNPSQSGDSSTGPSRTVGNQWTLDEVVSLAAKRRRVREMRGENRCTSDRYTTDIPPVTQPPPDRSFEAIGEDEEVLVSGGPDPSMSTSDLYTRRSNFEG